MKRKTAKSRFVFTVPPHPENPQTEGVLIDRELRRLLELQGLDLHALTDALLHDGLYYYSPDHYPTKTALWEAHDNVFVLQQTHADPPIFSTSVGIGDAFFQGDELYVRALLPETICDGAPGRRLGDLVATGISSLDERRIIRALRIEEGPQSQATRIRFAPDLVQLGPRPIKDI